MKLYCAYKGCPVSAYVNRTVQEALPVQEDFSDWRFLPADRDHLPECLPDLCLVSEHLFRRKVLREAQFSPALNLTDIYALALELVPAEHRQNMPTETSLQTTFYRHRALLQQNPADHEYLTDDLVPEVCRGVVYDDLHSDTFFRGIVHFNVGETVHSIMFFYSEDFFVQLMRAPEWAADGTFRWLPRAFQGRQSQLFIIHFFIGGPEHRRAIPALYALCSHRDIPNYLNIIGFMRQQAQELNAQHVDDPDWTVLVIDGKTIMLDFESAIHAGFAQALPGTVLRGCDFHRCHAIYQHLSSELGLKAEYQNPSFNAPPLKDIVGALFALSFVEVVHVFDTFSQIVTYAAPLVAHQPRVGQLFTYFRRQWLKVTQASPQGNMEYIALWNFFANADER